MSMAGKHAPTAATEEELTPCPPPRIDGHEIHVNDEGFLTDPDEWNEQLATVARRPDRHRR